jgi:hypothetical protein
MAGERFGGLTGGSLLFGGDSSQGNAECGKRTQGGGRFRFPVLHGTAVAELKQTSGTE